MRPDVGFRALPGLAQKGQEAGETGGQKRENSLYMKTLLPYHDPSLRRNEFLFRHERDVLNETSKPDWRCGV
jgi:hypothetical protein